MSVVHAMMALSMQEIDLCEIFECAHLKFTVYGRMICSLVPRPHPGVPARRGSGDIRLIPRASLKIHSLLYHYTPRCNLKDPRK